jgi:Zn-dependent protease
MFQLFGFDVKVRPGFLVFMGLIVFINQNAFGLWLAGALAGFTLLHELGHAVAARRAGAQAAISLDFMAGYTSFRPRTPLKGRQQAAISAAGPMTQIAISLAVLGALGVNPLSRASALQSEAAYAIWWAGPVIGVLNLVPVLPLDGGHLTQTLLEGVLRRPALREMAIASLVVTSGTAIAMAALGHSQFTLFIAFLLIGQIQLVQATSKAGKRPALPSGWALDGVHLQPGVRPSPWQQAYAAVLGGDAATARRRIIDDLTSLPPPGAPRWRPPFDAPLEALQAVVVTLPEDLPAGNAFSESVLADVLLATGATTRAGEYAAEAFGRHRTASLAVTVARAAARLDDPGNAMLWVDAAAEAAVAGSPADRAGLAHILDQAPELQALRQRPEFARARAGLS